MYYCNKDRESVVELPSGVCSLQMCQHCIHASSAPPAGDLPGWDQHPEHLLSKAVAYDGFSGGLPGVVGAIDGTHIQMLRPRQNKMAPGTRKTHFYDYKQKHSVHVLTVADPQVRGISRFSPVPQIPPLLPVRMCGTQPHTMCYQHVCTQRACFATVYNKCQSSKANVHVSVCRGRPSG